MKTKNTTFLAVAMIFSFALIACSCKKKPVNNSTAKVVMLGDSHMRYIQVNNSTWNELMGTTNMVNEGYDGYTYYHIYNGFGSNQPFNQALAENPDFVYLTGGSNEGFNNVTYDSLGNAFAWDSINTPAQSVYWLDRMCQDLKSNNIPFAVHLPIPFTEYRDSTTNVGFVINNRMDIMSEAIKNYCREEGITWIDLRPYVCYVHETNGKLYMKDSLTIDGFHFNLDGYKEWAKPLSFHMNVNL